MLNLKVELYSLQSLPSTYNAPPSSTAVQLTNVQLSIKVRLPITLIAPAWLGDEHLSNNECETVVFSPVMNIAPASVSLSLPLLWYTVPKVKLDSVIVILSPVTQMVPPFEVDDPVTSSSKALPVQL